MNLERLNKGRVPLESGGSDSLPHLLRGQVLPLSDVSHAQLQEEVSTWRREEDRDALLTQLQQMRDRWRSGEQDYTSILHVLTILDSATAAEVAARTGDEWSRVDYELSRLCQAGVIVRNTDASEASYSLNLIEN